MLAVFAVLAVLTVLAVLAVLADDLVGEIRSMDDEAKDAVEEAKAEVEEEEVAARLCWLYSIVASMVSVASIVSVTRMVASIG